MLAPNCGNLILAITLSAKAGRCFVRKSASSPTFSKACVPDCVAILTNFSLPESRSSLSPSLQESCCWLTAPDSPPQLLLLSMLILLVPCSQSAVQLMHYLVAALLPAEILPKLDYSEGIPDDCVTLVAIPTLLLSEKQVRGLVEDLEVRFLGNHDPQYSLRAHQRSA